MDKIVVGKLGEWRKAGSSQNNTDIKVLLRDSVGEEVMQGLSGGSIFCPTIGGAFTLPNDNISDCSQRVNESSL